MKIPMKSISHSGISAFRDCQFYFGHYVARTPPPVPKDLEYFLPMTSIHKAMELWLEDVGDNPLEAFAGSAIDACLKKDKFEISDAKRTEILSYISEYGEVLEWLVPKATKKCDHVRTEVWLTAYHPEISEVPIRGAIDVLGYVGNKAIILDLKMTTKTKYLSWKQMGLYAYAHHLQSNMMTERIGFILPMVPDIQVANFSYKHLDMISEYVLRFWKDVQEATFEPSFCWRCNVSCVYKRYCPLFSSRPKLPDFIVDNASLGVQGEFDFDDILEV